MDRTTNELSLRTGAAVFGSEGDKVGKIIGITNSYILVEKGFFFPTDYYIPVSAIAREDADGNAYLSVGKDEALDLGWDVEPALSDRARAMPYDASGNSKYAEARDLEGSLPGSPALGESGYMGESETSPGLAADLTQIEHHAGSREL
jgi:hypothetical protein